MGELSAMPRIFALADLHLSLDGDKPMDIFGEAWRDHASRMAEAWDATVAAEDTVLLPGDISWARQLQDAARDLAWIGARPGRKLLLRGNHDSWWASLAKVREALPAGCEPLQNNSFLEQGWVVVGARGWLSPDDPTATASDARVFKRELDRLKLSIAHADRQHGRELPRLAMLHYPPWIEGREPTALVPLLERGAVQVCVYGHLHGEDHRLAVRGERNGLRYQFVSADAIRFAPAEIDLTAGRGGER
jgi:predicted phosphohydrolase